MSADPSSDEPRERFHVVMNALNGSTLATLGQG